MSALRPLVRGVTFTEGPRWRAGKLWFSDFYTHSVYTVDPAGKLETVVAVPNQPSGLGWAADGSLLVVSMLDRKLMRMEGGALKVFADLSGIAGGPCNDMIVDAAGRALVGNFGFDRHAGEEPRPASLARVEPDGRVSVATTGLMFPNGAVITPDGGTLIIAETMANRLTSFRLTPDGLLSNRLVWAELPGVFPDGICLDAEGAIWVADARGPDLLRVRKGGEIAERIPVGAGRHAFACMLGGDDRRDLHVCTAEGSGPAMAERRTGGIDVISVTVPGAGLP